MLPNWLPSWRLALNTLAGKPGRTALMIGAVALASSLVVAVSCTIASVQASMEQGITKLLGAAEARIIHQFSGRFGEDVLAKARAWPEVEAATGRLGASLTLVHSDQRRDPKTGELMRSTPSALGVDFALEPRFRHTDLVTGRFPQAPNEILIDPITADELRAKVGDSLDVQRFGDPITLTVAGIYQRQRLGAVQRPQVELDVHTLADAVDRSNQLTSVMIILKRGQDVPKFCALHLGELPPTLILEPAEMVRAGFNRQISASQFGFTVASVLTFMCASFIIVTALTTSVTERQREMAVTRCIGASRPQLFASQVFAGLGMSTLGAIVGIPLGIGLTALLIWHYREILSAGLRIHPLGVELAIIGSAAAGLLGALYPAWMASHVAPLRAMSFQARPPRRSSMIWCGAMGLALIGGQLLLILPGDAQSRFLAYAYVGLPALLLGYFMIAVPLLTGVNSLISRPISSLLRLPKGMLGRSIGATPFRHGFTAGALMVGIAILVSTWSSMTSILNDWVGKIKFADGFAFRTTGISVQQQQAIANLPFVKAYCPIGYMPLRVFGRQIFGVQGLAPPNVTCMGFDPDQFFSMNAVQWVAGDPAVAIPKLKDGTGIIVADRFLTTQKVKIGDHLTLGADRVQKDFEIVGAVNSAGLDIATQLFGIRSQYMDYSISCVFMDWNTVGRVFDSHDAHLMQLNLSQNISDKEAIKRIAEVAPGVQFNSGRWILKNINEVAGAVLTVESTVAFVALVLACLGMGNVILANIHGRRFEYGVLRAVGAHRKLLARLIFGEAAILALTGSLTGTLLGIHLAWVGAMHYRDLAGLPLRLALPIIPAAAGWLVLLLLTLLAALPGVMAIVRPQPSALFAGGRHG